MHLPVAARHTHTLPAKAIVVIYRHAISLLY